jgi:hypothetical protein
MISGVTVARSDLGSPFRRTLLLLIAAVAWCDAPAQNVLGEEPALGSPESRLTQAEIASGALSLLEIRLAGLKVFATQFRKADGFGDGPINPADTTSPGGRPTLQGNGTFLRVNGLDAQACLDCHNVITTDTVPVIMGVGGSGGLSASPVFKARGIDVADNAGNGFAAMDGRLINPPALFGTGGVQLVAKEMTAQLQSLQAQALEKRGRRVRLRANGIDFGSIVADSQGVLDTSAVAGVDDDLVIRPFGRKGEFFSVRQFDLGALMFHMGMQPVEEVGADIDADGDGVVNEVLSGEVSALEIFITTQERPVQLPMSQAASRGFRRFGQLGCTDCHTPAMTTASPVLTYSLPEVATDPSQNVFFAVDLRDDPAGFGSAESGGIVVPMFSDLKRHDMGPGLAEAFFAATAQQNREFITARLWGVADSAPYLHDGRALTLNEAIELHGGEAQPARDAYVGLTTDRKNQIIAFLRTLRNPQSPNADVLN